MANGDMLALQRALSSMSQNGTSVFDSKFKQRMKHIKAFLDATFMRWVSQNEINVRQASIKTLGNKNARHPQSWSRLPETDSLALSSINSLQSPRLLAPS